MAGLVGHAVDQAAVLERARGVGGHAGQPVEQVLARVEPLAARVHGDA